jgi:phosphatidylinositol alpha-1,6-mannosyltransferase
LGVRLIGRHVRVIAISHETARLCRDAGFVHVAVVTLGVDAPLTPPPDNVSPEEFVLFVGRLVRRKGAAWFVRNVLPLLPAGVRLVVVGKAWDDEELSAVRDSERVDYRQVVTSSDLRALRRGALAVVMPNIPSGGTDIEGFGLTAVEAGAEGGVLVAANLEGIVDAVVDEVTGFLLPTGDAPTWAAKIREIQAWDGSRRAAFIRACQSEIAARYSWPAVASRTLDAYGLPAGEQG